MDTSVAIISPRLTACGMCGAVDLSNRYCRKHAMVHCNACQRLSHKNAYSATGNNLRAYRALYSMKARAARKGLAFDLDIEWMQSKLERGCCEVTGIKFTEGDKGPFSPSVDREDVCIGYVKTNCQMVVLIHNFARNEWGDQPLREYAESLIRSDMGSADSFVSNFRPSY